MNDERMITAAIVTTGEKSDGKYLQELIEKSRETGMEIDTVIGDTAYSEKENIRYAKENEFELVSKLNPQITHGTRTKEDEFEFNKDAGMYVCKAGHMAIRKARTGKKNIGKNQRETYYFDIEKCKVCPFREGCYKEGAKSKSYSVTIKSTEHKDQEAFQNSDEFKEKAKSRYKIEACYQALSLFQLMPTKISILISSLACNSSAVPERTTLPVSITYARFATDNAILAFCSTNKIVVPSLLISLMT